jgi:hypothetical protein
MSSSRMPLVSGTNFQQKARVRSPIPRKARRRHCGRARRSRLSTPRCGVPSSGIPQVRQSFQSGRIRASGRGYFPEFAGTFSLPLWKCPRGRATFTLRLGEAVSAEAHRKPSQRWRNELQRTKATCGAGNRAPPPVAFSMPTLTVPLRQSDSVAMTRWRPRRHLASRSGDRAPALDRRACRGASRELGVAARPGRPPRLARPLPPLRRQASRRSARSPSRQVRPARRQR